jgi:hypothetical protein
MPSHAAEQHSPSSLDELAATLSPRILFVTSGGYWEKTGEEAPVATARILPADRGSW